MSWATRWAPSQSPVASCQRERTSAGAEAGSGTALHRGAKIVEGHDPILYLTREKCTPARRQARRRGANERPACRAARILDARPLSMRHTAAVLALLLVAAPTAALGQVTITVDAAANRRPIDPNGLRRRPRRHSGAERPERAAQPLRRQQHHPLQLAAERRQPRRRLVLRERRRRQRDAGRRRRHLHRQRPRRPARSRCSRSR